MTKEMRPASKIADQIWEGSGQLERKLEITNTHSFRTIIQKTETLLSFQASRQKM